MGEGCFGKGKRYNSTTDFLRKSKTTYVISNLETYCLLNSVLKNCGGAQWDRAFALQAECWVFESQPRPTLVVKTSSNSFTPKRSAKGVSVTAQGDDHYKRLPRVTVVVADFRKPTTQWP